MRPGAAPVGAVFEKGAKLLRRVIEDHVYDARMRFSYEWFLVAPRVGRIGQAVPRRRKTLSRETADGGRLLGGIGIFAT